VNYLQYIKDAVSAGATVPVYALMAPQAYASDFIVLTVNGIDVTETKDQYKGERVSATLFLHFADADAAQNELAQIRHKLQNYPRVIPMYQQFVEGDSGTLEGLDCVAEELAVARVETFRLAWMESMQAFYNENDENIILSADFTFLIYY
jgi:hypothetical protein